MRKLAFGLRNLGYNVEMALGSVTWEGFYEGYCKDL